MRAVFSDFDGVINTTSDWEKRPCSFREEKFRLLADFVRRNRAAFVITSSWRKGVSADDDRIPVIHAFHEAGIRPVLQTPVLPGHRRAAEIERFLYYHPKISEIAVLDDDPQEFEKPLPGLILIHAATGLTEKDLDQVRFVRI